MRALQPPPLMAALPHNAAVRTRRASEIYFTALFVSMQRLMPFKINGQGSGFSPMTMLLSVCGCYWFMLFNPTEMHEFLRS